MRIVARRTLVEFSAKHKGAKCHLDAWWKMAEAADWATPQDVRNMLPKASIVAGNRVVFDICGGSYRLVVKFNYEYRMGYIRFVGTHSAYDKTDVTTV